MLTIYKKQLQKTWLFWIIPVALLVAMALLVVGIWPDYEPVMKEFETIFAENPLFSSLLGESSMGSFEGFISVEMFIVADFIFMGLIVLVGTMVIAWEADSGTLDVILSYPIPRWKFLSQKLLAIITLSFSFPVLVWGAIAVAAAVMNIEFKQDAFLIAILGKWIVYMAFTCITILCSVIFMDTTKTLGSAGLIVGGSWIFERFGGLIRTANEQIADILQGVSLFHYIDGQAVMNTLMDNEASLIIPINDLNLVFIYPVHELALVLIIGIAALLAALFLFQKREFTYI
ncbi:MAG: ABC transporter permease subunit [Candidatus Heimdallarchaeota archaeon]|nr:MAG: ABC transporter permease subunit [Candidatus Heimdallarchaeota archaeon]